MLASRAAPRLLRSSAAGALILLARAAAADGLQLRYEPLFTVSEATTTDASGVTRETSSTTWTHLASARLDRPVFEYVRLSASTLFEWGLGSTSDDGRSSQLDSRSWNTHAQLALGPRELNFTPYYTRSERSLETLTEGTPGFAPRRLRETFGAYASWRPEGLPALGARLARTDQLEGGGAVVDRTTIEAALEASYILETADLRYRLDYDNPVDHLEGMEAENVRHQARAAYGDRFLADRVSLSGSYVLNLATSDTKVTGTGGVVETRQALIGGLSAIEAPPATPISITLVQTPALVDGDRTAGVGLDLGLGSDSAPRHIGAQLANAITPVSVVHVWVHQPLPDAIVRAFSWTAYRSDDNVTWTPIAITGSVTFGAFDNRFEIPIARTEARYLKVVTPPLPPGTTLDPRFADILVTEIELLDRVAAEELRGRTSRTAGAAGAALRAKLLAERRLFYGLSVNMTHSERSRAGETGGTSFTWDVTNGLSYDQALGRALHLTTRLDRTDSWQRDRQQSVTRALASLAATPLPTLTSTATYTASLTDAPEGRLLSNTVLASVQAQPYQGVAVQANATYGIGTLDGETRRTHSELVSAMLTPHRALTLSGTFNQTSSRTDVTGGVQASTRLVEGSVTFAPVEAIYLAGSLGRLEVDGEPQRVANVNVSVRPFPRGSIYLSIRYEESYNSSFDARTRTWGPSLRWNIHRGNYLESSYTVQDSSSTLLENHLNLFVAKLSVSL